MILIIEIMQKYKFASLLMILFLSLSSSTVSSVDINEDILPILIIGGDEGSGQSEFNEPDSIFVSSNNLYYAGDTNNLRVQIFDSNGNYINELTGFDSVSGGNEVQGIGELNNGTIVVVEKSGGLYYFNPDTYSLLSKVDLKQLASLSTVDTQGLTIDQVNDNIFITNQPEHLVIIVSSNGTLIDTWSTGANTTPENMVIDHKKELIYISTEGKGSIQAYTLNGTFKFSFGSEESYQAFEGLAIDPFGNILAVDEGPDSGRQDSRIIIYDNINYSAIYSWGGQLGDDDGRFISPDGLAYDYVNNRVLIADQGNFRIQIFDYVSIVENLDFVQSSLKLSILNLSILSSMSF